MKSSRSRVAVVLAFALALGACTDDGAGDAQASGGAPPSWLMTAGVGTVIGDGSAGAPSGGTPGASGAAGASASAAGASTGAARTCQEQCGSDADCQISSMPADARCSPETARCESSFERPCSEDVECTAATSGWALPCRSDTECTIGGRCVRVTADEGRCASLQPSEHVDCSIASMVELTVAAFETGAELVVCGTAAECGADGRCVRCVSDAECAAVGAPKCYPELNRCGCGSDADCATSPAGHTCDTATGSCGCRDDVDCGGLTGTPVCDEAGVCGCSTDADCSVVPGADTCYAGRCGCSAATTCASAGKVFDGTEFVCE